MRSNDHWPLSVPLTEREIVIELIRILRQSVLENASYHCGVSVEAVNEKRRRRKDHCVTRDWQRWWVQGSSSIRTHVQTVSFRGPKRSSIVISKRIVNVLNWNDGWWQHRGNSKSRSRCAFRVECQRTHQRRTKAETTGRLNNVIYILRGLSNDLYIHMPMETDGPTVGVSNIRKKKYWKSSY